MGMRRSSDRRRLAVLPGRDGYADPGRDLRRCGRGDRGRSREPGGCARSSRAASTCSSSGPPGIRSTARRPSRATRSPWPRTTSSLAVAEVARGRPGPRPVARHQPRRRSVPRDRPDADDAGFDPGRALARPTGEFVLLRDVRIALVADADGPAVAQPARVRQPLRRRSGRGRPDARASSSRAPRWSSRAATSGPRRERRPRPAAAAPDAATSPRRTAARAGGDRRRAAAAPREPAPPA